MSISWAIKTGEALLLGIGVDTARLDAQILCGHVLGMSRLELILAGDTLLSPTQAESYLAVLKRRLCYEPIAYITGKKEFYGHDFFVNQDCLIPRPETECVLEAALRFIPISSDGLLLDLCTGSGAIGLSAMLARKNLRLIATDISDAALAVAAINADKLGLADRADLVKSDLLHSLPEGLLFDMIISNPPYIAPTELALLAPDIKDFEPHVALFSRDESGLGFYREIIRSSPRYLKRGGLLVFEMGFGQCQQIQQMVGDSFKIIEIFTDLAGIERGIILQKE